MDYNTVANHIPSHRNKIERHSTERNSTGQNGIKQNSMELVVSFGAVKGASVGVVFSDTFFSRPLSERSSLFIFLSY
jgi:hypothetical protein